MGMHDDWHAILVLRDRTRLVRLVMDELLPKTRSRPMPLE
jgi:hypothetical protein